MLNPYPLLPLFFSGCGFRSTWVGNTVRPRRDFIKKRTITPTFKSLEDKQKKMIGETKQNIQRFFSTGTHFLSSIHPSRLLEKPKRVFVSCLKKSVRSLALKSSVTRNLQALPSALSADSSSNVNQF